MKDILSDPHHTRSDLKMVEMAVRKWGLEPEDYERTLQRTREIRDHGDPRESLAAIRVIVAMHKQDNPPATAQGTTVNVGVKVDNQAPNTGRGIAAQVLERIRAAELSEESAESSARTSRLGD